MQFLSNKNYEITINMAEQLDKICMYYDISRSQRKTELERGVGYEGTLGFERAGCYDCDGYKKDCETYYPKREGLESL